MHPLPSFVSFFRAMQLCIGSKCQRQFHFFAKRLLWQTLGSKNSWAGENIHALLSNVLSKLHRNSHLHCFWWSNLTTREKVAAFFRKYKILLWIFLLDLLKVQNAPCPCRSMYFLCCLHNSPLCPRERQSHKVDVAVGVHKFSSVLTVLLSLNHLFPKWTLIAQHLSATTLIRSVLQKKGNFYRSLSSLVLKIFPDIDSTLGTAGDLKFMGMWGSMSTKQAKTERRKKV